MPEEFKRHIAYKIRIGDLLLGKPVFDNERFSFLELGDKKIVRANIVGNIVDKYENLGDKKYIFSTLDDGSGQIKLKAFGDDSEKLKNINQGQTIVTIGVLRVFNNEIYILPEIIKEQNPKYLLVRKLELEKQKPRASQEMKREEIFALKDKLLDMIRDAEKTGGVDVEQIIMKSEFRGINPNAINQEIHKLIEDGIIFEPRPGKLRWLG